MPDYATIILPGTGADVVGQEIAMVVEPSGIITAGLEALYLFTDGSGTSVADSLGGSAGAIDSLASSNNAYSWLSGGGVSLSGAQMASFPAFEMNSAWTIMTAGGTFSDVGAAGDKITGIIGVRNFGQSPNIRGAYLYHRGGTDLDVAQTSTYYQHRPSNGSGGQGTPENINPTFIQIAQRRRLHMISYNGSDTITSRIYDKDGVLVASDSLTTDDATLFTIGGTTVTNMQWSVGGPSATYANGVHQHEWAARYSRGISDFSSEEIAQLCLACEELGTARGRAW